MKPSRRSTRWLICGLTALAPGCAAERAAITPSQVVAAIIDADNRRDLEAVAPLYSDDIEWIGPGGLRVVGKAAILERYREMYGQFRVTLTMSVEAETTDGNLAYVQGITRGALTPLDGGDAKLVEDRFVAILTRSGSNWRVTRLLWGPANESTSPSQ